MRQIIAICVVLWPLSICAQAPVSWRNTIKKVGANTWEIHLKAIVQSPWHIYSQKSPAGGPKPVTIHFAKTPVAVYLGSVKENGTLIRKFEEVFGVDVMYYNNEVDFVQTIQLKGTVKTNIKGSLSYMVCNDSQCLTPPIIDFDIPIQ